MAKSFLSDLIIKKVTGVTNFYSELNASNYREQRPRWAIIIKYEGETVYTSNNKEYVSNINNIVMLPMGSTYQWKCLKAGHYYSIEFECDIKINTIFQFRIKDGEKIFKSFKEMEYKRTLKKPMYEIESIRDCYSVILKLTEEAESASYSPSDKRKKLFPAVEYIAKNYTKSITNDELAQLTGFSTVYFRKLFTNVYGVSPIKYVHNLRIKKAKEMLKGDYGNITDIAYSLGYHNIYDFSRTFKKFEGVPPSKF